MRDLIRKEVCNITPLDDLEESTIRDVVSWIDSGAELCRLQKPAIPNRHLVSYFPVVDGEYVLLVDHINAERWLPTGGHVEPGEHPKETARRECAEELGLPGEFLVESPILITSTKTVGKTVGHTDVSLWYALAGDRTACYKIDEAEFREARWFHKNSLPENTDPHLTRFLAKLETVVG